ncbi:TniQ family protein [Ferrimonas sp.]|uniref:TniQ family protein n=1 Tax=Ferrimonas sp. TaxID=2080861 RepID=UPI003A95BAF1
MELLIRQKPFADESLESYLLRLSVENGFESYRVLSTLVYEWLLEQDLGAAGAFPRSLALVNVFHANRSSGLRIRALQLFEQLGKSESLPLLKLAVMHSSATFGNRRTAVFRDGVDIPRSFIRKDGIPICPQCLAEEPYVRQCWHFTPYVACHKHCLQLVANCPGCGEVLDYQAREQIIHCRCSYNLRYATSEVASPACLRLSRLVVGEPVEGDDPLAMTKNLPVRLGALLWSLKFNRLDGRGAEGETSELLSAMEYFDRWPECLFEELELRRRDFELRLSRGYNRSHFREVFGDLLVDARRLPMRDLGRNFVLRAIVDYLCELVHQHPKSKQSNIADVLLSMAEAAAVLSTNLEVVYRLYQEGFLVLAIRTKGRSKLEAQTPAFRLRDVMELRLARMQSQNDGADRYLPAW